MQEVTTFDVRRAMLDDYLDSSVYPQRVELTEGQSLQAAFDTQQIAPDTRLLTFEKDGILYTVPMTVVLSYNVIQVRASNQESWMMTFCNACNTGNVFDNVVDGKRLNFRRRGAYDGLLLISDEETDSYWQHITGKCLHGESLGKQLRMVTTTRQMTAAQALAAPSKAVVLASPLNVGQQKLSHMMEKMRANPETQTERIISTIAQEDTRRPRFELGLGVWNEQGSAFFPLVAMHENDNVLLTEFCGRRVLIYQMPDAIAPVAAYLEAKRAKWEGDVLRLDGGTFIHNDLYHAPDKEPQPLERPTQLLMRWYGFALTFPGCSLPLG
jgi:hypothetical protein